MSGATRPATTARDLRALAGLAALLAACSSGGGDGPRPTRIAPDRGLLVVAVPVRIEGEFEASVTADFSRPEESAVDARFRVLLGGVALEDVRLQPDGSLSAVVPAGLATGPHDLEVIDPTGRSGALPRAYRVLAPDESTALVAGFRLEVAGGQEAFRPFEVTVTAVDGAGATVTRFRGEVRLDDTTGTVVPQVAGLFVEGRWTGRVEIRAPHPSTVLTATDAAGHTGATEPFAVVPAAAARLAYETAPIAAEAGRCEGPVTVALLDAFGAPTRAASATAIDLAAAPATGFAAFADPSCTVPLAAAVLAAGDERAEAWYRATRAGPLDLTASAPPLPPSAQRHVVSPAPAAALAFVTEPQTVNAGACSLPSTVEALDRFGNASPPGAASVSLVGAPADGLTFFDDDACAHPVTAMALPPGATRVSFRFGGTLARTVTATATAAGLDPAVQDVIVTPQGSATRVVVLSPPRATVADECSDEVTLQAQDSFGNAVAGAGPVPLTLAASRGDVTFFSDAGCTAPIAALAIAAGQSTAAFRFRGTIAGPVEVTASSATLMDAAQTEEVLAAAPAAVVFATPARTVIAGACSDSIALALRDRFANPAVAAGPVAIALTADPAAGVAFYSDEDCAVEIVAATVATGAGGGTFHFRPTAAGPVTLTASAPGLAPAPAQVQTVSAGPPDHLELAGAPGALGAGECSAPVTVRAVDAYGNPAPLATGASVSLAAEPAAGFDFHTGEGCAGPAVASVAIGAGASSATLSLRGTAAGAVAVTAAAAGMAPDATHGITILPATPDRLVFTTDPRTTEAGACSEVVRLEAQDRFGNLSPVLEATDAALSAAPASGFAFYADAACTAEIPAAVIGAGATAAELHHRGTAAGTVALTAAVAGWTVPATQTATVTGASAARLAWDPIPSPQAEGVPFTVTVRALDAWGNPASGFSGTATLAASTGSVACSSSCSGAAATGGFEAGAWTGAVAVQPAAAGVTLGAWAGPVGGTSSPFEVVGVASRSPPTARFTVSPAVIVAGQSVTFDASGSSDRQTPAAQLEVSWDFQATVASFAVTTFPAAAPWTAWSTSRTASHTYASAGTYQPRLAVRDAEAGPGGPDLGYATATVVVLPSNASPCLVTTAADVDDGATSCTKPGPDGKLSLREAIRLSSKDATIAFAGPMTISGTGTLSIGRGISIVAQSGVVLDGISLSIAAAGVFISGLELTRQAAPLTIEVGAEATLRDLHVHDGAGILVLGTAALTRVRMSGCGGACLHLNGPEARVSVWFSEFRGAGGSDAIHLQRCGPPGTGTFEFSPIVGTSVFSGFDVGVRSACDVTVVNDTFAGNGTGIYGTGLHLLNTVFSGQTVEAVGASSCASAFGGYRRQQLLWLNAAGCLAPDLADATTATFVADPLFVSPAERDYRIQHGSPAKDTGYDYYATGMYGIDLNDAAPGLFLGAEPDRGGRETY